MLRKSESAEPKTMGTGKETAELENLRPIAREGRGANQRAVVQRSLEQREVKDDCYQRIAEGAAGTEKRASRGESDLGRVEERGGRRSSY